MKKLIAVLLSCVMLILCFAACGNEKGGDKDKGDKNQTADTPSGESVTVAVSDEKEYDLYHEIFFDEKGEDHEDKTEEKTGTFVTLYDAFNKVTRYYVWGYGEDHDCDWQWELKVKNTKDLPANGSLVTVSGKFEKDEAALDGYWFTEPEITVKTPYGGTAYDVDMSVMSATLERVQIVNMQSFKEEFEDKSVAIYGRVVSENLIAHPYSDESWQQHFFTDDKVPKEGTMVLVTGTFCEGVIENASLVSASQY